MLDQSSVVKNDVLSSVSDWYEWLSGEEQKTVNAYRTKPELFIGHFRRERDTTAEYKGREVLELLQNAADAAKKIGQQGQVLIELSPAGLIVANSGAAFSTGGVQSLQTPDFSPKFNEGVYIGNKGLGFRAVLNWSDWPVILSQSLALTYCEQYLTRKTEQLCQASPELNSLVQDESQRLNGSVSPGLPFPAFSENGDLSEYMTEASQKAVYQRCQELHLDEKYTTVIGMPFKSEDLYEVAKLQIQTLRPEILLFVHHLDKIAFRLHDEDEYNWSRIKDDDSQMMVMKNGAPIGIWRVFHYEGIVPKEEVDDSQQGQVQFELIVAVPEVQDCGELVASPLFSHFPTNILMPIPVVCHASLELDQSRNHILDKNSNRYVLHELAGFVATIAEQRAVQYPAGCNAGFRLLIPLRSSYPHDLEQMVFPEALLNAARTKCIVPTLGGKAVRYDQAYSVDGADESWLPAEVFEDVTPIADVSERDFFKKLGVKALSDSDFRQRLLAIENLSLGERVRLIVGLIENCVSSSVHSSALLLSSSAESVPDNATVLIAPKESKLPSTPSWVSLRYLDSDLARMLSDRLRVSDSRDLQRKMRSFGLQEYSLANLIQRVIANSNQYAKEEGDSSEMVQKELIQYLFKLFELEDSTKKRPAFPERASLSLININGDRCPVNTLYMGTGYGSDGNIVQSLYGACHPEQLVAAPHALGLKNCEKDELISFMQWIGVSRWPRETSTNCSDTEYKEYLLGTISYPVNFNEYHFNSREEASRNARFFVRDMKNIDGLEAIIESAPTAAIAAWLALDEKMPQLLRAGEWNARFSAKKGNDRNWRSYRGRLPSFIKWKLEGSEWLIAKDGSKMRPKDCVLGTRLNEALFLRPVYPESDVLELYGLDINDLIEGWRRGGVASSIAELEKNRLYELLLEWPERHPDGKSARALYKAVIDAIDTAFGEDRGARSLFFESGKMWSKCGEYYPIGEMRHDDLQGFPQALLDEFTLVDLPHRVGSDKVRRTFGVNSLDKEDIEQRVNSYDLAGNFDVEFQSVKPFWYCLRVAQSSQVQNLESLKRLKLRVCSKISTTLLYQGKTINYSVPVWGWLIDNGVLYVRSDPAKSVNSKSTLLAEAIGAAIASLFRIASGAEFVTMFLTDPEDREALLEQKGIETTTEEMERILKDFGTPVIESVPVLPQGVPVPELEKRTEGKSDSPSTSEPVDSTPSPAPDKVEEADLKVEGKDCVDPKERTKRNITVKRVVNKQGGHTRRVTDYNFVERKALEVEAFFDRFPVLVGHITGYEAPGCDILSFSSAEHRDEFLSGENRDSDRVERFIEVKGRRDKGAAIELRGNEMNAAHERQEKYYIYRMSKNGEGSFELSILNNPMAHKNALEQSIYVDMDRAESLERFNVSGGSAE
ncbi:protein of unknown function [Paucidesulfovibrio gracilis DSM 16080]|uniref:Protein NO VEIN C-terminal domain-containing protein n=1 Tax=Paucidesulfovibrio gracilis DSM 16080 TaxID=1121449 RepID=A0A1T4W1P5_9BACT|nr:DUF3883 domain-containing protein [Paucidesulfovibrio gracilis]SKA71214.1 protein of unknown function [Paucidesulfovibrio gracilis DSM 16080]